MSTRINCQRRLFCWNCLLFIFAVLLAVPPPGYAQKCNPQRPGLVSWWRAEDSPADTRVIHGGILVNHTAFVPGMIGKAFSFDGIDDYVQIQSTPALDRTDSASMEVWVRFDVLPSTAGRIMTIMGKGDSGRDLDLQAEPDNKFHFYIAAGTQVASQTIVDIFRWYHVVATWDSNGMRIYVDGILDGTNPVTISRQANGQPLQLGESPYFRGRYFKGFIDEATFYNRALNEKEVLHLAQARIRGKCLAVRTRSDFDGDGIEDKSVYRPSEGTWYALRSSDSGFSAVQWGLPTDKIVPADYDGDGKTDVAIFRPDNGSWWILKSSDNTLFGLQFGMTGDVPLPADYDGDGKADFVVFRATIDPSQPDYHVLRSSDFLYYGFSFGLPGDKPVTGDFDGDGKYDVVVYRGSTSTWYMLLTETGFKQYNLGEFGDVPLLSDFDGDNEVEMACYRPSNGTWYVRRNTDGYISTMRFGLSTDVAAPGDYDGDGISDITVFRPSDGNWHILTSANGGAYGVIHFGANGDLPVASAYLP